MKLGISFGSYTFTAGFITVEELPSRKHELLGLPLRYHEPRPQDPQRWFIERMTEYHSRYGVSDLSLWLPSRRLDDSAYLKEIGHLLAGSGLDLSSYELDVDYTEAAEAYAASEADFAGTLPHLRKQLSVAERLGAHAIKVTAPGRIVNRYRKDLPLERQIARFGANLAKVIDESSSFSFKDVLVTNHPGYKVRDIVQVLKTASRDQLAIDFNTGNPLLAFEDPVSAAKEASPYMGAISLRDLKVIATVYYGCRVLGVPLGKGSVDMDAILSLVDSTPASGGNLSALVETTPAEGGEDRAVSDSLDFVTSDLKRHF